MEHPSRPVSGVAAYLWRMAAPVVLALAFGWTASTALAQTDVAPAGSGTLADPYLVTELGNLVWLTDCVTTAGAASNYYQLMNDIDASDTANWPNGLRPIGWKFDESNEFRGVFDGQGHAIRDLSIHRTSLTDVGLFGYVNTTGVVRNLVLHNVTVFGGVEHTGGLVGQNDGAISNCRVDGLVTGLGEIGGVAGWNSGTISDCFSASTIASSGSVVSVRDMGGLVGLNTGTIFNCSATGGIDCSTGGGYDVNSMGGLVGYTLGGSSIANCFATGSLTGQIYVGGLVGYSTAGPITNCYATGSVTGSSSIAGLVGANYGGALTCCYSAGLVTANGVGNGGFVGYSSAACNSCYWDTQTSGRTTSAGGTGKTTAQMKQQATFVGWNFTGVWGIQQDVTYPYLTTVQQPPAAPLNVAPASGATRVALAPTLFASPFSDRNTTDTHAASQWQVRADTSPTSWTLTTFDSGVTATDLVNCTVSAGALTWLTDYWWRVRYEDNHGNWSDWSTPATFRTLPQPPPAPTNVAASDGAFSDRVRIAWATSPGASDYAVFRSTHPTTATAVPITAWMDSATSYDDLTASPGVIYYYWVLAATNAAGADMSGFSARDSGWYGSVVAFPSNRRGTLWILH